MSRKKLIALFVSIFLAVVLVISGCAPVAEAPITPVEAGEPQIVEKVVEKIVEVDKVYRALNPQGAYIPVDCKPLAPRLTTFDGKTILAYCSEANFVIWPVLYPTLVAKYPKTTFVYVETQGQGRSTPNDADLACDAVIRGISW